MSGGRRFRQGGVLLITVGVLASLVAILAATAATQSVTLRAIGNRMHTRRAHVAAESGIQFALATLVAQDPDQTTQQDDWYATLGQTGTMRYTVASDTFRLQVVDAASLINLNTATEAQLSRLPLTQEQIDSLLDWKEAGTTPRPSGGKDEYYTQLPTPYNAKLQALTTFNELLLVRGFTARAIYDAQTDVATTSQQLPLKADGTEYTLYDLGTVDSVSSNVSATGTQKPNITTATLPNLIALGIAPQTAQAILLARPTSYTALLGLPGISTQSARSLVNTYAVTGGQTVTGKINVNTASEAVLQTIPNMPPDIASAIVTRQTTPFTQLGDLFDVPGYSVAVAAQTLDSLATNSRTFLVRVVGSAGQAKVSLEALVSISANGVQVLKTTQLPHSDMSTRWGWDAETTSETVLKEATQQ